MRVTNESTEVSVEEVVYRICECLVKKRKELGYTQDTAACMCDMKKRTYEMIERNENLEGLIRLMRALEGLDITLFDVLLELITSAETDMDQRILQSKRLREYHDQLNSFRFSTSTKDAAGFVPYKSALSGDFVHMLYGVTCFFEYVDTVGFFAINESDIRKLRQILENSLTSHRL